VVLTDPKGLFRAENVVPLAYKPAVQANPKIYNERRRAKPSAGAKKGEADRPSAPYWAVTENQTGLALNGQCPIDEGMAPADGYGMASDGHALGADGHAASGAGG
jgi:hypothetical protein